MAAQQQKYTSKYPSLLVTVKHETEERSVAETRSNSRTRRSKDNYRSISYQPKSTYYNSNNRTQSQQYFARPPHTSPRQQQQQQQQQQTYYNNYDRVYYSYQNQPIRPLMEINDLFSLHQDLNVDNENIKNTANPSIKQREPKQRGQYRNRKAELDWDHAFDLDLIDLYPTYNDSDSHSLTSTVCSSDNSFSSV